MAKAKTHTRRHGKNPQQKTQQKQINKQKKNKHTQRYGKSKKNTIGDIAKTKKWNGRHGKK